MHARLRRSGQFDHVRYAQHPFFQVDDEEVLLALGQGRDDRLRIHRRGLDLRLLLHLLAIGVAHRLLDGCLHVALLGRRCVSGLRELLRSCICHLRSLLIRLHRRLGRKPRCILSRRLSVYGLGVVCGFVILLGDSIAR